MDKVTYYLRRGTEDEGWNREVVSLLDQSAALLDRCQESDKAIKVCGIIAHASVYPGLAAVGAVFFLHAPDLLQLAWVFIAAQWASIAVGFINLALNRHRHRRINENLGRAEDILRGQIMRGNVKREIEQ